MRAQGVLLATSAGVTQEVIDDLARRDPATVPPGPGISAITRLWSEPGRLMAEIETDDLGKSLLAGSYILTTPPSVEERLDAVEEQLRSLFSAKVLVQKDHPGAVMPKYQKEGDAGLDLSVCEAVTVPAGQRVKCDTGLKIALPLGFEAQIRPRSGLAANSGITVINAPGTLDAGYRGPLIVCLINHGDAAFRFKAGDRIAQLVIARVVKAELEQVDVLPVSERGEGGFGSTGL